MADELEKRVKRSVVVVKILHSLRHELGTEADFLLDRIFAWDGSEINKQRLKHALEILVSNKEHIPEELKDEWMSWLRSQTSESINRIKKMD